MEWRTVSLLSLLAAVFVGCAPQYYPAFYHHERPLLFAPDREHPAWAVGLNVTHGRSLNSLRSYTMQIGDSTYYLPVTDTVTGVSAALGYCLAAGTRWLSLRASAIGYAGSMSAGPAGSEGYGGVGIVLEPAFNLPLGEWLSVSLVQELGAALEFGRYARRVNVGASRLGDGLILPLTLGIGAGATVHLGHTAHLVLDARLLPGSLRAAFLTRTWGVHASVFGGKRWSIGASYLLAEPPPRRRR
jgi:hypothetical protein